MIKSFTDIFPIDLINDIHNQLVSDGWKYGWRSHPKIGFSHWNQQITKSIVENSLDTEHMLTGVFLDAWKHLKNNYYTDHSLLRCYANAHTFGIEGYPHHDSRRKDDLTLVVYLNKIWKREWGGETLIYYNERSAHAELPKYNHGISFPGWMTHAANGVTRICPETRITLMFKVSPKDIDPIRDSVQTILIELGADKIPHGNRYLINHLLNVYDLLKWANRNQHTCLGGAFHSIFGTNIYQYKTLTSEDQEFLAARIGTEATQLAIMFCEINRPLALEKALRESTFEVETQNNNFISLTREQFYSLVAIEAANLYEQNQLDERFPILKNFWHTIFNLENITN